MSFFIFSSDGALYSATSNNFLNTEPIILRSLKNPLRTEFKASWLNGKALLYVIFTPLPGTGLQLRELEVQ